MCILRGCSHSLKNLLHACQNCHARLPPCKDIQLPFLSAIQPHAWWLLTLRMKQAESRDTCNFREDSNGTSHIRREPLVPSHEKIPTFPIDHEAAAAARAIAILPDAKRQTACMPKLPCLSWEAISLIRINWIVWGIPMQSARSLECT